MKCCPLCLSGRCSEHASDAARTYTVCLDCELVFVTEEHHVSEDEERARYELHDNSLDNDEYMNYLREFAGEMQRIPVAGPKVLDFGSGPARALEHILKEQQIECVSYDPMFGIGPEALDSTYDIVVVCETVEHLRKLRQEILLIKRLLNPGGHVMVRTELYNEGTDFETWWYAKDTTHVNFFRLTTMVRVGELLDRGMFYTNGRNVVILG